MIVTINQAPRKCIRCDVDYDTKSKNSTCSVCKNGMFRYGLDRKQQIDLLEKQNCCCALCGDVVTLHNRKKDGPKNTGNIDHCHKTNVVRGVLCHTCNVTLGYLENKKISLDRLKEYASVSASATNGE